MIHPTAIIDPKAEVHPTVRVGPYAVIDGNVKIGPGCTLGPHVYLTGHTTIGADNHFFAGCVIGEAPQDLKYRAAPTSLLIQDRNVFREHATVHRSNKAEEATVIGSDNFLMAHCHVAHNCHLGNHVIIANGALLGGHVSLDDRAFISGNCLVHQFVRVGTLALMQGGSAISKDLPPYTVARGDNGICGLNTVGLRRAGFSSDQRLELKELYQLLFRAGMKLRAAIAEAQRLFPNPASRIMVNFVASATRGICSDTGHGLLNQTSGPAGD